MMQKVHFRLTSVAQQRCCLSSLLPNWETQLVVELPMTVTDPDLDKKKGGGEGAVSKQLFSVLSLV